MSKKEIYFVIFGILILSLIPVIVFLITFNNTDVSDDITNWGAFGDYMGGTLNCFFSLLSLFVTIYIAFKISNIEENRNRENLKFEKEKLLREFRESEYKKINSELQKVWICITEENSKIAKDLIYTCIFQYRYFITSNKHLFDFLNDREIFQLKKSLDEIFALVNGSNELDINAVIPKFVENLDAFNRKFQIFLLKN